MQYEAFMCVLRVFSSRICWRLFRAYLEGNHVRALIDTSVFLLLTAIVSPFVVASASVWLRNIQLGLFGFVLGVMGVYMNDYDAVSIHARVPGIQHRAHLSQFS